MEALGLGVGLVGLAGLFSTCVDCLHLVQHGRYMGKEYLLLETKFANQRVRLITWGRACGLMDEQGYDLRLEEEEARLCIENTLTHIVMLFKDESKIRKKYGLRQDHPMPKGLAKAHPILRAPIAWTSSSTTFLSQKFGEFKSRLANTQKQASYAALARWAIEDKEKFMELVQHLKDLIDDLESLTRYLDVQERQRDAIHHEIESVTDITTLETIEEARMGRIDAVSDAASLRLRTIRDQYRSLPTINPAPDKEATCQQEQYLGQEIALEDWDFLPGKEGNMPSVGDEIHFQILYKVRCHEHETNRVYLDPPIHRPIDNDSDEWTNIDARQPGVREESMHLRDQRTIPDTRAYFEHNTTLAFVLFHNCKCCDDTHRYPGDPDDASVDYSFLILSESLRDDLGSFSRRSSYPRMFPDFKTNVEVLAPFKWFYNSRSRVEELMEGQRSTDKGLIQLFGCIEHALEGLYAHIDESISIGFVRMKFMDYIFVSLSICNYRYRPANVQS